MPTPRSQSVARRLIGPTTLILVAAVIAGYLLLHPRTVEPGPATEPSPASAAPPSATATTTGPATGSAPTRLTIKDLGVDAPVVSVGLDEDGNLGAPEAKDKRKAGWYSMGPRPGDGRGNVLMDGHTYVDGSAIFQPDFGQRVRPGTVIEITGGDGTTHRYAVSTVMATVHKTRDYPGIVERERLYDFNGPERLVLVTCSGPWNSVTKEQEEVSVLIADPVR